MGAGARRSILSGAHFRGGVMAKPRILVVDDDRVVVEVLSSLLDDPDREIVTADCAAGAPQGGEELIQIRLGNALPGGDLAALDRAVPRARRQVHHRPQRVFDFRGEQVHGGITRYLTKLT